MSAEREASPPDEGRIEKTAAAPSMAEEAKRAAMAADGAGVEGAPRPVKSWTVRKEAKKPRSLRRTVIEIVVIVVAAFAIAMLVQAFIVKPFTIHQISMEPTLLEGDRVLINRLSYKFSDPEAGDVVVFHSPVDADEDLVKRIVAVAGDRVAIEGGDLLVNGEIVEEPYLLEEDFGGSLPEVLVEEGMVFVLGDNRDNSGDSRLFGAIDADLLIGRAFAIYWPIGRWGGL